MAKLALSLLYIEIERVNFRGGNMFNSTKIIASVIFFTLLTLIFITPVQASNDLRIACETPTGDKAFVVNDDKVAFSGRTPSSLMKVSTRKINNGFTQTLVLEGQKHIIHVEDVNNMNEADDYLWVISRTGHKFLYPVTCAIL